MLVCRRSRPTRIAGLATVGANFGGGRISLNPSQTAWLDSSSTAFLILECGDYAETLVAVATRAGSVDVTLYPLAIQRLIHYLQGNTGLALSQSNKFGEFGQCRFGTNSERLLAISR